MRRLLFLLVLCVGCAHPLVVTSPAPALATAPAPAVSETSDGGVVSGCPDGGACPGEAALEPEAAEEDDDDASEEPVPEEEEAREAPGVSPELRYTRELSDEKLKGLWSKAPQDLGSISIGFADEGRLINAEPFPEGEGWTVVAPGKTWGTHESIQGVVAAIGAVRAQHPEAPPLRVNQMSAKEGGYLPPHKSHQSGRDVDLAFYYRVSPPGRTRDRWKYIDPALNWALIKALIVGADVQLILVDRKVQKVLYDHALKTGEDPTWLNGIFRGGKQALVKHARRHRDHFHVRFFNPRAQELGRRLAPLLALRPEQNIAMHRVRRGNVLGAIARKYGTTVQAIQRANRMRGTFLRVGALLRVPLRGPCTRCPVPPPVEVPPRRLPPAVTAQTSPPPPMDAGVSARGPPPAPAPVAETPKTGAPARAAHEPSPDASVTPPPAPAGPSQP